MATVQLLQTVPTPWLVLLLYIVLYTCSYVSTLYATLVHHMQALCTPFQLSIALYRAAAPSLQAIVHIAQ